MVKYYPTIGLEVHIELNTASKIFCSCANDSDAQEPNINICPVCTGQPGSLPVVNREAIIKIVKTGLALDCEIAEESKFDRKNYFYPDLPKGYQISQYDKPFCQKGKLKIKEREIRITRIHLEEDAGKLVHPKESNYSLVDFNRAGVPLMELVTEPDIHSAQEAKEFAEELRLILRYLQVSSADMEKGELRVDANISLSSDRKKLGDKVEIKNINSFKAIEKAINYEIERQKEILDKKERIYQETRGWDEDKQKTILQRSKEESHDYRYFPEPDLPAISIKEEGIDLDHMKASIPELPKEKRERFKKEYGLDEESVEIFINDRDSADYYEKVISELNNWIKEEDIKSEIAKEESLKLSKAAANYILGDLRSLLKKDGIENIITPENFAELIKLIHKKEISSKIAKILLQEMLKSGADPSNIIEEKGLSEMSDSKELALIIKEIISQNEKAVDDLKQGKEASLQFLIGQVMAKTKGKANPESVKKIIEKELS